MNILLETNFRPLITAVETEVNRVVPAWVLPTIEQFVAEGCKVVRLEGDTGVLLGAAAIRFNKATDSHNVAYLKLRPDCGLDALQVAASVQQMAKSYDPI